MRLENSFAIDAPADSVWGVMMDFERVATCIPGTEVIGPTADGGIEADVRVKVGPMAMSYRGTVEIVEQDAVARQAVMRATARERRGQGGVEATMTLNMLGEAPVTVDITTDLDVTGRVAQMGQGVMQDVAGRIMSDFAKNLKVLVGDVERAIGSAPTSTAEPELAQEQTPAPADRPPPGALSLRQLLVTVVRGRLRAAARALRRVVTRR